MSPGNNWKRSEASFGRPTALDEAVRDIETVYYNESKYPKDKPHQALTDKIGRGELGVKTGIGFYTYPNPEFSQPDFLDSTK